MDLLIELGCNCFQNGVTALILAVYYGSSKIIEILLSATADVNTCVTAGEVGNISLVV